MGTPVSTGLLSTGSLSTGAVSAGPRGSSSTGTVVDAEGLAPPVVSDAVAPFTLTAGSVEHAAVATARTTNVAPHENFTVRR
jgi:hypothetical protein